MTTGSNAARHLLAATTSVPRVEDAEIVLNTAVSLRRQRRAGDAADLLQRALDAWGTAPAPFLALLWMGLGEARWDLSEKPAALECFDRAAESAGELDIAAVAPIEIARQRYHNPFIPDPAARQRLADLDDQLATDDSALRAALLGRRAMLALQPPARRHEASAFADAAVSMARRIDDSDALLTALCDRAFVVGSAHDVLCRKDLAEEVVEIARITGRPDGAIAGHEWRFDDCLMRGDLAAAATALEEFEALASVAPSPYWRYASSFRRAMLLVVQGDRDGAVDTVEASGRASSGLVDHFERVGVELGVRAPAMILYGLADPEVAALHGQMIEVFDRVPSPFMQVRLAVGELLVGDRTAASRRATRWLADPARAYEALDPVGTLGLMAILADELQMAEPAVAIVGALDEFRGLLVGEILLPVDLLIAQLALLTGRTADAVARAHSALGLARAMPSPVVEALCLRGLAEAQLAAGDRAAAAVASAAAAGIAERIGLSLAAPWSRRATDQEGTARSTADAGPRTAGSNATATSGESSPAPSPPPWHTSPDWNWWRASYRSRRSRSKPPNSPAHRKRRHPISDRHSTPARNASTGSASTSSMLRSTMLKSGPTPSAPRQPDASSTHSWPNCEEPLDSATATGRRAADRSALASTPLATSAGRSAQSTRSPPNSLPTSPCPSARATAVRTPRSQQPPSSGRSRSNDERRPIVMDAPAWPGYLTPWGLSRWRSTIC